MSKYETCRCKGSDNEVHAHTGHSDKKSHIDKNHAPHAHDSHHECICKTEMPKIFEITKIVDENRNVRSFFFENDGSFSFGPGQFVMLWLPGIDEKPFTISSFSGSEFSITVEKKGAYTERLFELEKGDRLGIRGPYGKGFSLEKARGKNVCIISGGCGTAPVMPLIEALNNGKIPKELVVVIGCQCEARLIFRGKIEKKGYHVCTDDGSFGYKGFVTEKFKELIDKGERFDTVYTCGPEPMMKAVFDLCGKHGIECEASLERFMICGIGICGQCMCDDKRVCQDGPVFGSAGLRKLKDFGVRAMIKTGKKVPLKEYYSYRTKY